MLTTRDEGELFLFDAGSDLGSTADLSFVSSHQLQPYTGEGGKRPKIPYAVAFDGDYAYVVATPSPMTCEDEDGTYACASPTSLLSFRYTYMPTPVTNVQITDRFERGTTLKKPVGVAVGAVVRDGIRDETYFAYVVTGDEKIVGFEVVNKDGAPALKYSEEIMGIDDDPDAIRMRSPTRPASCCRRTARTPTSASG